MFVCPKCSKEYTLGKICRECGAILEEVAAPSEQDDMNAIPAVPGAMSQADLPAGEEELMEGAVGECEQPVSPLAGQCPKCSEELEPGFDVCWNCGTARDGTENPDFALDRADGDVATCPGQRSPHAMFQAGPCVRCGSSKVIPNVAVGNQGHDSGGKLEVMLVGNPHALIFKDIARGELRADICGDCGHVELRARNSSSLYEHYLATLEHQHPEDVSD